MRRYTLLLIPDTEEGGYTVRVPSLPGLTTEGDTLEEAIASGRAYTADEWNWFIQQARGGEQQPDPYTFGFTGEGRTARVSWDVYRSRRGFDEQGNPTEPPGGEPPGGEPPGGEPPGGQPPPGGPPTMIYPSSGDFGHPSSLQPYPFHPATDSSVEDLLTEDRYYWASRGEALSNQIAQEIADQKFRAGVYSGALEGAYGVPFGATPEEQQAASRTFAERGGGYTPEEAERIKRTEDLMGLRTSEADQSRLFFGQRELQGGYGDTTHTVDEWNFYIQQRTGQPQTIEPAEMGDSSRGEQMTYADYIARRQAVDPDFQPVPLEESSMYMPGIYGDLGSVGQYFRPEYLTAVEQSGADVIRGVGEAYRTTLNAHVEDTRNRLMNAVDRTGMSLSSQAQTDILNSLGQGAQAIRAALDRNKLEMSPQAMQEIEQILAQGDERIRTTIDRGRLEMGPQVMQQIMQGLETGAGRTRGTIDKAALTAAPEYLEQYQFGPEDQQRYVETVAASEGQATQAALDRMRREAAAAGNVGPLALAAAESRARQTGEVAAGDAVRRARLDAKKLFLDTLQQREQTRLAAEQGYAGLASGVESDIAQRELAARQWGEETRLGAEQSYAAMAEQAQEELRRQRLTAEQWGEETRLGAEQFRAKETAENEQEIARREAATRTELEQTRMQGAKDVTGAYLEAETEAGRRRMESELAQMQSRLDAEKEIAAGARATAQYITGAGTELEKYKEATGAERALEVAKNRQATEQYAQQQRYTQGMETNVAAAQREQEVAAQRIKAEQEYRGYLAGQQELASQNQINAQQQQIGAMTGQIQGMGGAGATLANYKTGMKTNWAQLIAGIAGGAGAAIGGALGEGAVVTEPTSAILGERGPEMVIPLRPDDDAVATPDYLIGRRRLPRYVQ